MFASSADLVTVRLERSRLTVSVSLLISTARGSKVAQRGGRVLRCWAGGIDARATQTCHPPSDHV